MKRNKFNGSNTIPVYSIFPMFLGIPVPPSALPPDLHTLPPTIELPSSAPADTSWYTCFNVPKTALLTHYPDHFLPYHQVLLHLNRPPLLGPGHNSLALPFSQTQINIK